MARKAKTKIEALKEMTEKQKKASKASEEFGPITDEELGKINRIDISPLVLDHNSLFLFKDVLPKVQIKTLANGKVPSKSTEGAAGYDVFANNQFPIWLQPGEWKLIPLGFSVAIPKGYHIELRPRSGLALKNGITLKNCVATIDDDFRGEVQAILSNDGNEKFEVIKHMKVAQLLLRKNIDIDWEVVESLDETDRAGGGFGSTGNK